MCLLGAYRYRVGGRRVDVWYIGRVSDNGYIRARIWRVPIQDLGSCMSSDRGARRKMTVPSRRAGLRGECPPASAWLRMPPPLFLPEGLQATPDSDRRLARKRTLSFACGPPRKPKRRVRVPLGAK